MITFFMAKKFNFRLDPILKIKEFEVKEAKNDLTQVFIQRQEKERMIEEHQIYRKELSKSTKGKTPAANLQTKLYHKSFIENEISKLEIEKIELLGIEKIKRDKLTEAMKEEKILTRLKQKKKNQYLYEINREETINLDEIARNVFLKNVAKEK